MSAIPGLKSAGGGDRYVFGRNGAQGFSLILPFSRWEKGKPPLPQGEGLGEGEVSTGTTPRE